MVINFHLRIGFLAISASAVGDDAHGTACDENMRITLQPSHDSTPCSSEIFSRQPAVITYESVEATRNILQIWKRRAHVGIYLRSNSTNPLHFNNLNNPQIP